MARTIAGMGHVKKPVDYDLKNYHFSFRLDDYGSETSINVFLVRIGCVSLLLY